MTEPSFPAVKERASTPLQRAWFALSTKYTQPCMAVFCLLVAILFITLFSKSSPLYPFQDWVDVHCYYSVGRAMNHGTVLYRDIVEQKGPMVYFLYALADRLFPRTFFGAYLMEVVSMGLLLYVTAQCIRLYTRRVSAVYIGIPLLACVITTSKSFTHGGSVEETLLFCLAYVLYTAIRICREGQVRPAAYFLNGICLGLVFWSKYTMVGLYIGVLLCLSLYLLKNHRPRELGKIVLVTGGGFLAISLPVLLYFGMHGALRDLGEVYFYDNLFAYSNRAPLADKLVQLIRSVFVQTTDNYLYTIPMLTGLGWILLKRNFESLLLPVSLLFLVLFQYIGGTASIYYNLPLSVFAIFGVCAAADWLGRIPWRSVRLVPATLVALLALLTPLWGFLLSNNTPMMQVEREELAQYRFAAIMAQTENPTLFNYGFLDGGFYFAADIPPSTKYFCRLNMQTAESRAEMERYITEGVTDYVVTRNTRLEDKFEQMPYECVAIAPFQFENLNGYYRLYRRASTPT